MNSIRSRFTRSIGTILCTIMLLSPSFAHAQWVDPANLVQNIYKVIQGIMDYVLQNSERMKEYVLDVVQKGIATNIEQRILESSMEWARSGFRGQPSFIVNPTDLVLDSEWNEAEKFMGQLNSMIDEICTPFRPTARAKVAKSAQDKRNSSSGNRLDTLRLTECDLDEAVTSGVIDNYYSPGGFEREGGYDPLIRIISQRKNNPYELPEVLKEIQAARQAKAVKDAKDETTGGTLPNKECVTPGPNGSCERSETKTPSSNVSAFISKAIGHSLDEISGQDEILESIFAGIVRRFTEDVVNRGLR